MSLESVLFRRDFYYNLKFVEKCIKIIQTSNNEKRVKAYKSLVFKMMKSIVKKNVANYLNLLRNVDYPDIPERDELISDCYVVFDKCVSKFLVDKGYNFYFYFNKSLSRNFFREYYKKIQNNNFCHVFGRNSNSIHRLWKISRNTVSIVWSYRNNSNNNNTKKGQ